MSDTPIDGRVRDHEFHQNSKEAWRQQNLRWETENAFLNHQMLYEMRLAGRARCLSECSPHTGPCIVVGSGSSVDSVMPLLKDWIGGLLCSTSHGTTLVYHGAPPTYMSCLDPRAAPEDEMGVPSGGWDRTHFLSHVSAPAKYFKQWFQQTTRLSYVFRILEPTYDWYSKHLPWAYPWVKVAFLPFIDSSASNISLAARLGYDPIYVIGMDYGGRRFEQHGWKNGEWTHEKPIGPGSYTADGEEAFITGYMDQTGAKLPAVIGPGGLITDAGLMYSKRGMLISVYMQLMKYGAPKRIYQMSKPSNCMEFPFVDPVEVIQKQGRIGPDEEMPVWDEKYRQEVADKVEISLAQSDTYMIPVEGGFGTDFRVYMMSQPNVIQALSDLNLELLRNKADLQGKEKDLKMRLPELIEKGIIQVESGELLIHERADLKNWSVDRMAGINIEKVSNRIRWLYEESKKLPVPQTQQPA